MKIWQSQIREILEILKLTNERPRSIEMDNRRVIIEQWARNSDGTIRIEDDTMTLERREILIKEDPPFREEIRQSIWAAIHELIQDAGEYESLESSIIEGEHTRDTHPEEFDEIVNSIKAQIRKKAGIK